MNTELKSDANTTISNAGNAAAKQIVTLFPYKILRDRQADVASHAQQMSQLRTHLQERAHLKTLLTALRPHRDDEKQVVHHISNCPSTMRARMAVRAAMHKMHDSKHRFPPAIQLLEDELAFLEKKVRSVTAQLRKLECRILKTKPVNSMDSQTLLAFLGRLTASGRRFKRSDLADILPQCANAMTAPANQNHPTKDDLT
jgi:homoserine trans-succinylase